MGGQQGRKSISKVQRRAGTPTKRVSMGLWAQRDVHKAPRRMRIVRRKYPIDMRGCRRTRHCCPAAVVAAIGVAGVVGVDVVDVVVEAAAAVAQLELARSAALYSYPEPT